MSKDKDDDSIIGEEDKPKKDPLDFDDDDSSDSNSSSSDAKDVEEDPTKIKLNKDMINVPSYFWHYARNLFSIKSDVNIENTVKEIRENVVFSGINVWVLICSIIVASVGLMSNSIPVVIGAMLISPLMGPIRGIGLGAGIYDFKLVVVSLKNFGVMMIIALLASFFFFLATPFQEVTPELLARTNPDFRDVLIAFFGGLAGIIAASRGRLESVISGVAIATALMPPLCTAGFALSIGEWDFFFGAFYLFLLNSIFICLSTYIFVRYLKFPLLSFVNIKVERKVKIYTAIFIVLLIVPAGFSFYKVSLQGSFNKKAQKFVKNVIMNSDYKVEAHYTFGYGSERSKIEISPILGGATEIPEAIIINWKNQMGAYDLDTSKVDLIVFEGLTKNVDNKNLSIYQNLSEKSLEIIGSKDMEISKLNVEVLKAKLRIDELESRNMKVNYLDRSLKLDYPDLKNFVISRGVSFNNGKIDTLYVFVPKWKAHIKDSVLIKNNIRLKNRITFEIHDRIGTPTDSVLFLDKL